jgi:hypothetical protein
LGISWQHLCKRFVTAIATGCFVARILQIDEVYFIGRDGLLAKKALLQNI